MKLSKNIIGSKEFYSKVVAITVPIIVQNAVTHIVNLLDNVMVGRIGTLEMSAVAIVNQLLFVFSLCIFGGMAGVGIFSTQYAGAKDNDGIRYCFRAKLVMGFILLLLAAIVFLIFPKQLISMYLAENTAAEEANATISFALSYLKIMLIGLVPFTVSQIYASTLRETGETKLPMIASVAAIFVNVVFNYFLIFGKFGFPKLGVAGAAIATSLSRFVEAAILIISVRLKREKYPFMKGAVSSLYVPKQLTLGVITRGLPLLVNEALWSLGMATLLQCYSVRGLQVVAAANIANTANTLFSVVYLSMGTAIAIVVGQNLGANEIEEANQNAWRLIILSVLTCAVMGTLLALLSPYIPLMYNTEQEVRILAKSFLYVVAAVMPIEAFAHACYFTIRSGGRTGITFAFDSMFTWLVSVPAAIILANFTKVPIVPIFLIIKSLEFIKCLVGGIMVKKRIWIKNIIE
ncbi:MAG: MATE family efflux transporter [Clostridia bacterium]|nr:MATE family efflux transporter [Clostridia bacterium]